MQTLDRKGKMLSRSANTWCSQNLSTTPPHPARTHDELLVRLLAGERVGSQGLRELMASQRALHEEKLRTYLAIEEEHFREVPLEALPPEHRLVYMTLRRGILGERAWLAWADEVEAVLPTIGKSPR